ncbi:hypothetical protein TYRP_017871 [Tyrophagus putrescentiae]|nr:hypothetical protein TYRP_017871 [Tyrophagus putrescentiae]
MLAIVQRGNSSLGRGGISEQPPQPRPKKDAHPLPTSPAPSHCSLGNDPSAMRCTERRHKATGQTTSDFRSNVCLGANYYYWWHLPVAPVYCPHD